MKWFVAILVAVFVFYELAYLCKREMRSTHIYNLTLKLNAAYRDCTNQDFTKRDFTENGVVTNWPDGTRIFFSTNVCHVGGKNFPLLLVLTDPSMAGVLWVTTNHVFIWADSYSGAEIVDENHRPPLFQHPTSF
jgi:hypothetical protein